MNRYEKRIAYKPARNRDERRRNARDAKFCKLMAKIEMIEGDDFYSQSKLSEKHLLNNFPDTERRDELSTTQKALSDKQLLPQNILSPLRPDVVIERGYISSQDAREATILIKEENKNA